MHYKIMGGTKNIVLFSESTGGGSDTSKISKQWHMSGYVSLTTDNRRRGKK